MRQMVVGLRRDDHAADRILQLGGRLGRCIGCIGCIGQVFYRHVHRFIL